MSDVTHLRFEVSLFPRCKRRWSLASIPARRGLAHFEHELAAPAELIVGHPASIELLTVECHGLRIIVRIRDTRCGDIEPRLLRRAPKEPDAQGFKAWRAEQVDRLCGDGVLGDH